MTTKTIQGLFSVVFVLAAFILSGCDKEKMVGEEDLPQTARQFISQYFPGDNVVYARYEKDGTQKSYNVALKGGTTLEFYKSGEWKDINCGQKSIPDGILAQSVTDYVASNHPDQVIVQADKERNRIEIKLQNGTEIYFDKSGNFIGYDF